MTEFSSKELLRGGRVWYKDVVTIRAAVASLVGAVSAPAVRWKRAAVVGLLEFDESGDRPMALDGEQG